MTHIRFTCRRPCRVMRNSRCRAIVFTPSRLPGLPNRFTPTGPSLGDSRLARNEHQRTEQNEQSGQQHEPAHEPLIIKRPRDAASDEKRPANDRIFGNSVQNQNRDPPTNKPVAIIQSMSGNSLKYQSNQAIPTRNPAFCLFRSCCQIPLGVSSTALLCGCQVTNTRVLFFL
jgi:hypothetical protein